LSDAGFIAADEEASELLEFSRGDDALLEPALERRLRGEPLAWIVGFATFCGLKVQVDHGVYVPRWQSHGLARRAISRLPLRGTAVDLCTGSGAMAKVIGSERPHARVVATDIDVVAAACATSNGVEAYRGDLFTPLPHELEHQVDVVVGVVPYVPTSSMSMLPRDTLKFESPLSYDGGTDGTDILRRVIAESPQFLRVGGALLLEIGGDQAALLSDDLNLRFANLVVLRDDDGDVRALEATLAE
jgi:release factor glutamine methyltransferase